MPSAQEEITQAARQGIVLTESELISSLAASDTPQDINSYPDEDFEDESYEDEDSEEEFEDESYEDEDSEEEFEDEEFESDFIDESFDDEDSQEEIQEEDFDDEDSQEEIQEEDFDDEDSQEEIQDETFENEASEDEDQEEIFEDESFEDEAPDEDFTDQDIKEVIQGEETEDTILEEVVSDTSVEAPSFKSEPIRAPKPVTKPKSEGTHSKTKPIQQVHIPSSEPSVAEDDCLDLMGGIQGLNDPPRKVKSPAEMKHKPQQKPVPKATTADISCKKHTAVSKNGVLYEPGWSILTYLTKNKDNREAKHIDTVRKFYSEKTIRSGEMAGLFIIHKGYLRK